MTRMSDRTIVLLTVGAFVAILAVIAVIGAIVAG